MADSKIKWKIEVDGVDNLSNKLENIDKSVKKSSASLLNMVAVYQAATMAIQQATTFINKLSDEMIKADEANVRLNNTLKATGNFTKQTSASLSEYADNMEKILAVEAELVKDTLSFNMALGLNAEQAEATTTASASLAKALGVDLKTANNELAGTLSGATGRLAKFIPELKTLTKSQLESGEAINIINQRYNKYLVNTNSASELLKQQRIALDDITEGIAQGFFGGKDGTDTLKQVVAALRSINSSGTAQQIGAIFRDVVMTSINLTKMLFSSLELFYDNLIGRLQRVFFTIAEAFYRLKAELPQMVGGGGKADLNKAEEFRQKMLESQKERFQTENDVYNATNNTGTALKNLFNNTIGLKDAAKTISTEYDKQLESLNQQATVMATNVDVQKGFDPATITNAVSVAQGGISSIISAIGKYYGVIGEMIAGIVNFLNISKEEMTKFINGLVDAIIQLPQNIIDNIPVIFANIVNRIPEMISKLIPTLAVGMWTMVLNLMTEGIKAIPNLLNQFLNINFWTGIAKNMVTSLFSAFKGFFQALFFGKGSESISSIVEKGGALFNPTENAGKELFKIKDYAEGQVVQTFEDRVNTVTTAASKGLIQELFDALKGIGTAIWDGLKNALSGAWNWFKDIGSRIWEGIKDGFNSLLDSIGLGGGGGGGLWGSITGGISSIGDSVASVFGWAEGGLVQGNAPFMGNDYRNDTVPALLSAGEYVVSRDEMRTGDFSGLYAASGKSGGGNTSISLSINVGAGSQLTESQLRSNVVPVIVSELKKLSQNGTQIVSKKGVY